MDAIRQTAEAIAADLFTDGGGNRVQRLVCEFPGQHIPKGGWAQGPVADRVETLMRKFSRQQMDRFSEWMDDYVAALSNLAGRPLAYHECCASDGIRELFDAFVGGKSSDDAAQEEFDGWE